MENSSTRLLQIGLSLLVGWGISARSEASPLHRTPTNTEPTLAEAGPLLGQQEHPLQSLNVDAGDALGEGALVQRAASWAIAGENNLDYAPFHLFPPFLADSHRATDLSLAAPVKIEPKTLQPREISTLTAELTAERTTKQVTSVSAQAPSTVTGSPDQPAQPSSDPMKPAVPHETHEQPSHQSPSEALDLDPAMIQNSPVLQRWLQEVPNVLSEIHRDPSFRTRLRFGYSQFPSSEQAAGFNVGIEDAFVGRTGLTVSAEYQRTFRGDRQTYGGDLRYYILPLGGYINVAPVVGYRHLETDRYITDGVNVGVRLLLVPSRTGAADISLTQSWVAPGTNEEVGITTLSFGYALTHDLRLSTDLQKQNAPARKDSRVGVVLEWML
jgi:hypothetical protein